MQIEHIHVGGLGTLSELDLGPLGPGLTVLYGANGSGKTTLLRFLRGMFCGFTEARGLRLLPPLKAGTPGGKIAVSNAAGRFEVIRHARADHSDTLAISQQQGTPDDVAALRKEIQSFCPAMFQAFFAPGAAEAQDLPRLVRAALSAGVDLASRKTSAAWITGQIRELEQSRADLFQGSPPQGRIEALQQRRRRVENELEAARTAQATRLSAWQQAVHDASDQARRRQREADWLLEELQAAESDLTEVQTRLWSTRITTVQEVQTVERPAVASTPDWVLRIKEIDLEIAHAQQVLRDLAASRMRLSIAQADGAGAVIPDPQIGFQRQREALGAIEAAATRLASSLAACDRAAQCLCQGRAAELGMDVAAIQEQLWLICQEVSRQQAAHQHWLSQSEREGVDRCEQELTRQIQRLRRSREDLLTRNARTPADRLRLRTLHEGGYCECAGHEAALADAPGFTSISQPAPQIVVRERQITASDARPEDPQRERELLALRAQLRQQWQAANAQLQAALDELQKLECGMDQIAEDRAVQTLRHEYAIIEQQLADGREQWQSLALLQTVLQRTQQKLHVETGSPVIEDASAMLRRLTGGRSVRFRYLPAREELCVVNSAGAELPPAALSRGTLEQASLCFRLALCRDARGRGLTFPLCLDDVLADSDEDRLRGAVELLCEFSREQQVLFLTCQDHLAGLFESHQARVLSLPGSQRTVAAPRPIEVAAHETVAPAAAVRLDRVQPDEPFWLQTHSPIHDVPSLGEQMARRLGALGVRDVGELIELDPEIAEIPLESLQISAATLRAWQAEARLLCCVPDLTGRDAQLLVACGIQAPTELAEIDVQDLLGRVRRVQARAEADYSLAWLNQDSAWPSGDVLSAWIRRGRSARSWKRAREWSSGRRTHAPRRTVFRTESAPRVRLHDQESHARFAGEWRFYLRYDSPIVDAPSIGPKTAERLHAIGIQEVAQLLQQDSGDIARRLARRDVSHETVLAWQQQSQLMCRVPELRGHDAQILTACGISEAEQLAAMSPAELFAIVGPLATSKAGQRLLRSAKTPDLEEVTVWIECARHSPLLNAA
jgi:energy-coupling factor transporter ATP-binding protein EcfA2